MYLYTDIENKRNSWLLAKITLVAVPLVDGECWRVEDKTRIVKNDAPDTPALYASMAGFKSQECNVTLYSDSDAAAANIDVSGAVLHTEFRLKEVTIELLMLIQKGRLGGCFSSQANGVYGCSAGRFEFIKLPEKGDWTYNGDLGVLSDVNPQTIDILVNRYALQRSISNRRAANAAIATFKRSIQVPVE